MKVLHLGDIHACAKHHDWVRRALAHAVDTAIAEGCTLAVIAGDSFDSAISSHEPAFVNFVSECGRLADAMPVVAIYGTMSHDRPGSLDVLNALRGKHQILVIDTPMQLFFGGILISALPGLNKADPEIMSVGANAWVRSVLSKMGTTEQMQRAKNRGQPTLLVTHGTVTGCTTESGYAMVSPDHEFDLETLASADCDAVMLAHIHRHQSWSGVRTPSGATTEIAYSGSLARLVHGHQDPVGFLIWTLEPGKPATSEFHESPARQLLEIAFDGPPNMDELRELAATVGPDDAVRIRWEIDEEHAHSVDRALIRELFAGAETVKLEPRVLPIQRVRAAGIGRAVSIADKLAYWAKTTGSESALARMQNNLELLRSEDPEAIAYRIAAPKGITGMLEAA